MNKKIRSSCLLPIGVIAAACHHHFLVVRESDGCVHVVITTDFGVDVEVNVWIRVRPFDLEGLN